MMPPKTVRKKAAKGKSVDKRSTDERLKDQLEEDMVRLREELGREQREKSDFQLERGGMQDRWEKSRRRLEEEQAELRRKQREREEAEHRHREEITVYNQRLKHVLSEHRAAANALKAAGVTSSVPPLSRHAQAELELRRDALRLQAASREQTLHGEKELTELKLGQQAELLELEKRCRERVQVMVTKRETSEEAVIAAHSRKQGRAAQQVERRMRISVDAVVEQHDRALQHLNSHDSSQRRLLDKQNTLKLNIAEEMKLKVRVEKRMSEVEQANRRLKEDLSEGQRKLSESQERLEAHQQACAKDPAANIKARVKALGHAHRELSVNYVVLEQAVEEVQREIEERSRIQTAAILEAEQEAGLKHLVLERKLAALSRAAEKKEAELCAALSDDKLQELLQSKLATVSGLQRDLAGDRKEYDDLLQACRDRLAASGVPLHDFPFKSSKWILGGRTRVQDSAAPHDGHQ